MHRDTETNSLVLAEPREGADSSLPQQVRPTRSLGQAQQLWEDTATPPAPRGTQRVIAKEFRGVERGQQTKLLIFKKTMKWLLMNSNKS